MFCSIVRTMNTALIMKQSFLALSLYCVLLSSIRQTWAQNGFISIDCGATQGYVDSLGIIWSTEEDYINSGESYTLNDSTITGSLKTLRSFPKNKKNCYSLPSLEGYVYLVRATFLYGNYDGKNNPPLVDLIIDANTMGNVSLDTNQVVTKSYVLTAKSKYIIVCLGRKTTISTPFISSLELRQLDSKMYSMVTTGGADLSSQTVLEEAFQLNYGVDPSSPIIRFPDDAYDRIWSPANYSGYQEISSSLSVSDFFIATPPVEVLKTAIITKNRQSPLSVTISSVPRPYQIYYIVHFNDIRTRISNDSCSFYMYINGINLTYLQVNTANGLVGFRQDLDFGSGSLNITLVPAKNSTLGPLLSAVDILFMIKIQNGTKSEDKNALQKIKEQFKLEGYIGDPCLPREYNWDWVTCTGDSPARITAIDLSNRNLTGTIPLAIADLSALQSINLASNNLSGPIPQELLNIPDLDMNFFGNRLICDGQDNDSTCSSTMPATAPLASPSSPTQNQPTPTHSNRKVLLGAIVSASCALLAICVVVILICLFRNTRQKREKAYIEQQNREHTHIIGGEAAEKHY